VVKFWRRVLLLVIDRYRELQVSKFFRGDAAIADAQADEATGGGGLPICRPAEG
jgi:hypothetical protein